MNTRTTTTPARPANRPATSAAPQGQPVKLSEAASDAAESFREYATQRPDVVAMWAFGIGFVLGWRLKPW